MKKFFLGLLIGIFVTVAIPVGAYVEEYICKRAQYKVIINGEEFSHPELPILNYKGNTYAPFRPMLEAAGLVVEWNGDLGQAEVTTPSKDDTMKEGKNNGKGDIVDMETITISTYTKNGIEVTRYNDTEYVSGSFIQKICADYGYMFLADAQTNTWFLIDNAYNKILTSIPTSEIPKIAGPYFEIDIYLTNILPIINQSTD